MSSGRKRAQANEPDGVATAGSGRGYDSSGRYSSGTIVVLALFVLVLLLTFYLALGMPGMDHSPAPHERNDMLPATVTTIR